MKKYVQEKMVNWYHPKMLMNIGLKAMISGTFGNYADRRELEAALDTNHDNEEDKNYKGSDIWVDIINDTGDGFNATFAIAKTVAQKKLALKLENEKGEGHDTERGKILIFGGDEVYPFPSNEEYTNRFKIPYASAGDKIECKEMKEEDHPHMYAIPGNHDWYDGLGNFIKIFCQQRWIGIWQTKQHRSYFAIPLPNNYWIWATDIQLNSDIDAPQLTYFARVAKNKMEEGDKVILITAEPAWVYKQIHKKDKSFDRLEFFVNNYILNKEDKTGKKFKLAATLTGDLHHYARYCKADEPNGHQYITAGGGGAFLHLTHNLPPNLESIKHGNIDIQSTFPGIKESSKLLLWNFAFPFKNFKFTALLATIYFFFFWILYSHNPEYVTRITEPGASILLFIQDTFHMLLHSPGIIVMTLVLALGFYAFTDTNLKAKKRRTRSTGKSTTTEKDEDAGAKGTRWAGFVHSLGHLIILYFIVYCLSIVLASKSSENLAWYYKFGIVAATCFLGSIAAGLFMGTYLYTSNILFDMHINEASSSLASPDYKNFLRLHVHDKGVTIYPVGIRTVPRKWEQEYDEEDNTWTFKGGEIKPFLIENPIIILNEKL